MRTGTDMIAKNGRKRTLGWIAGMALAASMGLAGCSNDTGSSTKDTTRGSNVADSKDEGAQGKKKAPDASATKPAGSSGATGRSTAEEAVAAWVTAVIKGETKEACLLMGQPATGSSPALAGTPATCEGETAEAREMRDTIGRFREAFTPEPPTENPKVEVARVAATGDKAVIPADKVVVDGQTLHNIVLSHSTGVEAGQLDVTMESSKVGTAWYVTDLDLGIG